MAVIAPASETTAPMTKTPADSGRSSGKLQPGSVDSVPIQFALVECDASSTIAAGVCRGHPRASNSAAMSARFASPISTTTVAEPGATLDSSGSYADLACPDTTTNPAETPRWVTGMPANAGAATAEVTPGTT